MRIRSEAATVALLLTVAGVQTAATARGCHDALASQAGLRELAQFWDGYIAGWNVASAAATGKVLNLNGFVNGKRVSISDTLLTFQCQAQPAVMLDAAADSAIDDFRRSAASPVADRGTDAKAASPLNQLGVTVAGRDLPCTDLSASDAGPESAREAASNVLLGAFAGVRHARHLGGQRPGDPVALTKAALLDRANAICAAHGDDLISVADVAEAVVRSLPFSADPRP